MEMITYQHVEKRIEGSVVAPFPYRYRQTQRPFLSGSIPRRQHAW